MNPNQVRRTNIVRKIDELKAKVKREMIEDVEKVKRVENEDRNVLSRYVVACKFMFVIVFHLGFRGSFIYMCCVYHSHRLLTFCGMTRGVFRDNLVFGCNVVAVFVASGVVGACSAGWRDARRKRAKFGTNA